MKWREVLRDCRNIFFLFISLFFKCRHFDCESNTFKRLFCVIRVLVSHLPNAYEVLHVWTFKRTSCYGFSLGQSVCVFHENSCFFSERFSLTVSVLKMRTAEARFPQKQGSALFTCCTHGQRMEERQEPIKEKTATSLSNHRRRRSRGEGVTR